MKKYNPLKSDAYLYDNPAKYAKRYHVKHDYNKLKMSKKYCKGAVISFLLMVFFIIIAIVLYDIMYKIKPIDDIALFLSSFFIFLWGYISGAIMSIQALKKYKWWGSVGLCFLYVIIPMIFVLCVLIYQ